MVTQPMNVGVFVAGRYRLIADLPSIMVIGLHKGHEETFKAHWLVDTCHLFYAPAVSAFSYGSSRPQESNHY